jgi:hypothetical protein
VVRQGYDVRRLSKSTAVLSILERVHMTSLEIACSQNRRDLNSLDPRLGKRPIGLSIGSTPHLMSFVTDVFAIYTRYKPLYVRFKI